MATVRDIITAAQRLSPSEQLMLIQAISQSLQEHYTQEPATAASMPSASRMMGLHTGQVWMRDDFDAELPEAFWLGKDNEPAA